MKVEIRGVHLEITETVRNYLDAKMPRLDFAKDLIVDLLLSLTKEKSLFKAEATMNFRWGASKHVRVDNFDLNQAVDELFDKLDSVVEKEKSRIKDHHHRQEIPRDAE
jgi:putative sigma-54 modulation protein